MKTPIEKPKQTKQAKLLARQLAINEKNKNLFLVTWKLLSGQLLPERTYDTVSKTYLDKTEGVTCMAAPDKETCEKEFLKSFSIGGRTFKILSIKRAA